MSAAIRVMISMVYLERLGFASDKYRCKVQDRQSRGFRQFFNPRMNGSERITLLEFKEQRVHHHGNMTIGQSGHRPEISGQQFKAMLVILWIVGIQVPLGRLSSDLA